MRARGKSTLHPAHLLLLVLLLGFVLWRGHVVIEQGSRPPEPTPVPRPAALPVLVTVENLGPPDAALLARALEARGLAPCTGRLTDQDLLIRLRRATATAPEPPLVVVSVRRLDGWTPRHGMALPRAEAGEVLAALQRTLEAADGPLPPAVWIHLRDLAFPPPRLRAARRALWRAGFELPPVAELRAWRRSGEPVPEQWRPAVVRLHQRGLDAVRRTILALAAGGRRWVPGHLVIAGTGSPTTGDGLAVIAISAGNGTGSLHCPDAAALERLLLDPGQG